MNYYNEFDPKAAQWLRNLIEAKLIPQGDVDERSITEVRSDDLTGYTQCHFFAGIGGWSLALQLAGWDATRPVWTGSCPCQPFSSAGKQKGKNDERHLWPVWFELIRQSRPPVVFGEQVFAAIRHGWWDDVADDLEREGYATRAQGRPASSVGAPHKRDRLWFVGHSSEQPSERRARGFFTPEKRECGAGEQDGYFPVGLANASKGVLPCVLGNTKHHGSPCGSINGSNETTIRDDAQGQDSTEQSSGTGQPRNVADATRIHVQGCEDRQGEGKHWGSGTWIDCPDGKQRLVEPSIPLLAHGVPARVAQLRGLGNAIVPQVAAEFITAYIESED